jgi:hypothetical protein
MFLHHIEIINIESVLTFITISLSIWSTKQFLKKSSFILFRSMVYYRLLCDKKIQNILDYCCVTRIKLRKYYLHWEEEH